MRRIWQDQSPTYLGKASRPQSCLPLPRLSLVHSECPNSCALLQQITIGVCDEEKMSTPSASHIIAAKGVNKCMLQGKYDMRESPKICQRSIHIALQRNCLAQCTYLWCVCLKQSRLNNHTDLTAAYRLPHRESSQFRGWVLWQACHLERAAKSRLAPSALCPLAGNSKLLHPPPAPYRLRIQPA